MSQLFQHEYDAHRKTYTLTFPAELDEKRVQAWMGSISGSMRVGWKRVFGVPTGVLETIADSSGIVHRMRVASADAHYAVSHLETLVPGIHITEDKTPLNVEWSNGVELGLKRPSRTLQIADNKDFSTSVLTSMTSLRDDESVMLQWVLSPEANDKLPAHDGARSNEFSIIKSILGTGPASRDEIDDRRAKLATSNVLAVGRVMVKAPHELRAAELSRRVITAFSSASGHSNWITTKAMNGNFSERANLALAPMLFPAQFNVSELSAVSGWPLGTPYIAGLPQSRTRHMHVNNSVPAGGGGNTVLGVSNVPGNMRDIGIEAIERMKHVLVIGPIGVGKTAELTNMIEQDMNDGRGVVLIETKGDLFHAALERVPAHRRQDVIVWDLDDTDFPIGYNVLRQSTSKSAVDELNGLMTSLYPESGVLTTGPLYHGLHALAESPNGTFVDLLTIINPMTDDEKRWRVDLVKGLKNREIKKWWDAYLAKDAKEEATEAKPLRRRLWPFVARQEIRNSLGQSDSSFYMEDVVRDGKILLVNLNGVRIGQESASIIGTLIMNSVWNAVRTTPHDRPVILFMDEFQNFVTMPTSPSEMLAQSRSFGLGMVLAHQHTGQLGNELRDAVMANVRTKIAFQTSATDARILAAEFGQQVTMDDFMNLQKREAIVRVSTSNGVSQAFTMRTKDVSRPSSNPRDLRAESRAKYGRPVDKVEAAIEERRKGAPTPESKRPKLGGVMEWD